LATTGPSSTPDIELAVASIRRWRKVGKFGLPLVAAFLLFSVAFYSHKALVYWDAMTKLAEDPKNPEELLGGPMADLIGSQPGPASVLISFALLISFASMVGLIVCVGLWLWRPPSERILLILAERAVSEDPVDNSDGRSERNANKRPTGNAGQ